MGPSGQQALRGALVGLLVAAAAALGSLDGVERWGVNQLFRLRGPIPPQTPIAIIYIDEDSFDELDLQWPWPRALHAKLLDVVSRGKPAAIGLDLVFAEPSARGPDDDRALGAAIGRAGNVVLGAAITTIQTPLYTKEDLNPPVDALGERTAAFGYVNFIQDEDAFIRSASWTRLYHDESLFSFDYHLYRLGIRAGLPASPLPVEATLLINYRGGPRTYPMFPYHSVVNGEVAPETFAGKLVLVGATSPLLHDLFPTPFAVRGEMPGVEIHANVLETMFLGIPLRHAPRGLLVPLILAVGLTAVWLANRLRPLAALALVAGLALGYVAVAFMAFAWNRVVLDVAAVPLTLILGYGVTVIENFILEQRRRAQLMSLFSKHVSPEVADAIWQQRDQFMEGGRPRSQMQMVTVLFTDLKGYTTVSEKLAPQALLDWLNVYMEAMASLVSKHHGVVDDYAGDAIKANFGVPVARTKDDEIARDAINAVECALAMERELLQLNQQYEEQHRPTAGMRVGISTGVVVAGSLGSRDRLKYTTVGDTVNIAARLESFEKDLASDLYYKQSPCRILIDESTLHYLGAFFKTQKVGEVKVKGKEKKLRIYRLLGREDGAEPMASLRKDVRVKVGTTVGISDGDLTVQAPTSDVSTGGLSVYDLTVQFEKDQLVQVGLALAEGSPPLALNAKVAWMAGDKAGFRFLDLTADQRAAVEKFIS